MVAPVGGIPGPAAPVNRLRIVLGNALARAIQLIKVELRLRKPLLGKQLPKPKGFLVIPRIVSVDPILKIPRHHGSGKQNECGQGGDDGAHTRYSAPK